jgi:FtsZ-binding cell division protein ZapB
VQVQAQDRLEGLAQLEDRVHRAVDLIRSLKAEKQELQQSVERMREEHRHFESRLQALSEEKEELQRQGQEYRDKEATWGQFEKDREEIRSRIDSMLAKFEELEI